MSRIFLHRQVEQERAGLMLMILAKMRETSGVLFMITPFWTTSVWLPELLQLSIQPPLLLPDHQDTVIDLNRKNALPSLSKLKLTAWLSCSEHYSEMEPINLWRSSCVTDGGKPRRPSTTMHVDHGLSGVTDMM